MVKVEFFFLALSLFGQRGLVLDMVGWLGIYSELTGLCLDFDDQRIE